MGAFGSSLSTLPLEVGRPLVPLRLTQLVGFGVQHRVQVLFHGAAHQLVQMTANLALVDADDFTQRLRAIVFHGGGLLWSVLMLRNTSFNRPGPPSPQMCEK
jgi:hypothetical protein